MASDVGRTRRPTMADVATRAGVSLKTVSRVVNNAPHVQPELIERVLAAVTELGFRRNPWPARCAPGRRPPRSGC
ncbi:LacI family DNA-binding transcriptional regulator [Streptosporangium lutulentum]